MRRDTEHHDRIVAVILALSMLLSAGVGPVIAGVDGEGDLTAQTNSTTLATSISSCTTISSPGQYVLSNDITNSGASTCIRIEADDVILDGAGYTIDGIDTSGTRGVYVYEPPTEDEPGITLDNVTVTNLGVSDWGEGIRFDRVSNGTVDDVDAWSNEEGVRFDVLSRDHGVYGSGIAENTAGLVLEGGGGADVRENEFEGNDRGIVSSSDGNWIEGNLLFNNYDGVVVSYATGTDIVGNHFENHQSTSIVLRGGASRTIVAENEMFGSGGALAGVWIRSGNNDVVGNVIVGTGDHGVALAASKNNWIAGNQIEDVENGLTAYTASDNEFENNTIRYTHRAILLEDDAHSNVFRNDDVAENDWAFYAHYNSSSRAERLFVGNSTTPTTVRFNARDVGLASVSSPPATPPSLDSLDKFVYTEATSSSADLDFSVRYTDSEVNQSGVNESNLRIWRHNGSWGEVSPPNQVDTTRNVVRADVDTFGVLAPLAPSDEEGNVSRVAFKYGDYGGNLNIEINGEFVNFGQFYELDGTTVGGTSITVTNTTVSGGEQGTVEIAGSIHSFSVGGQEFWLDDVEFGPAWGPRATVDFENLTPAQSQYVVGETFQSSPDNVSITVENFTWSDGTEYSGGEAWPSNNSPPMSGGSGQDLYPDNVNVRFDVAEIVNSTSQP